MVVDALLPALNEEESLPGVLRELRGLPALRRVVVADNGSTDDTWRVISAGGAQPVWAGLPGYGNACLAGLRHLAADPPEVVVFLDADGADDLRDLPALLAPIEADEADMVIGSRATGEAEAGALTPVQRFGNALSCTLIRVLFGEQFTDLGPFRAIRWSALEALEMADRNFGWTVEMQAKAARRELRSAEVPVRYRVRQAGQSKVSGTVRGSVKAGVKILWTIGAERVRP